MTQALFDIVIPVHNRSNLVLRLLESIRGLSRVGNIFIIDDASSDVDREVLKTIAGVKYLHNVGNEGYVKSCRRGVSKGDSKYILLLNSDTEAASTKSVEALAENLDEGVAICGALLMYPKTDMYRGGTTQHCGIAIDASGIPYHINAGRHPNAPVVQMRRSVTAVTGAVFAITREWWDKISGLDPQYGLGVYEDVDACITVRKMGGEVIYEPRSRWYHSEHASQGQNVNWFTQQHLQENFNKLTLKHGKLPCDDYIWFKGIYK